MKPLTAAFITLLLLSMLAGVQIINKAKAETLGPLDMRVHEPSSDTIKIFSPQRKMYNAGSILLNFTVEAYTAVYDVGYSLDGGAVERVNNLKKISEVPAPEALLPPFVRVTYAGNLLLSNLPRGTHSVTIYNGFQYQRINERYDVTAYAYVNFSINVPLNLPPSILILSPENKVYSTSDVFLNFTVDEPISQVTYSLDGHDNVTVVGNTTLNDLLAGDHIVTVYGQNNAGNIGASNPIHFTITHFTTTEPKPEPEPFPTMLETVTLIGAIVTLGMLLSLVYFKKRKHVDAKQVK